MFLPDAADLELHHLYLGMDFLEQHKDEVPWAVSSSHTMLDDDRADPL